LLNEKLITGLNDPKGQLVLGDKFYVSNNLELVEVDLNTNKIINKYTDDKLLEYLNGLLVVNNEMYIGDWGFSEESLKDVS
jgi:hypothetical protein